MRDILIFLIVFGLIPFAFSRPHWGIYLWSWIGYMNPHRLGWGFAFNFPFALVAGVVTLISFFVSSKKLTFYWSSPMGWLIGFNIWMLISTIFSMYPDVAWEQWEKIIKIQLMAFLTLFALVDRQKIHVFVWVIVISIGFYGFKGGIFTLLTGGGAHVLGPRGGFIAGNTEIGLALVMTLPLVWYLYLHTQQKWVRYGLLLSMFLIAVGILGTQSRGAFLAISAVSVFLWLKSSHKLVIFIALMMLSPFFYMLMPESWHNRMGTIQTYEQDGSAMGRIHAWEFGLAMAIDRPLTGGGYESHTVENYERYVPHQIEQGVATYHDYHSIYFEILGEHGFVGLFLFLMLFLVYWRTANKIIKIGKTTKRHKWALDLAAMLQVSFIGYLVGGAFLGLAYFDLFYHYLGILIMSLKIIEDEEKDNSNQPTPSTTPIANNR